MLWKAGFLSDDLNQIAYGTNIHIETMAITICPGI